MEDNNKSLNDSTETGLTAAELERYGRQMVLAEIGLSGQQNLKSARVLVVGAGGLGCPALQYLVAAGVGCIGIADDDRVELSNLIRQILFSTADIGKPKVLVAQEKLQALNPWVEIIPHQERITALNACRIIESYDLVLDGSDNFTTRYLVNDTCVQLNKTLVFGSILKFEGQVSVFNYRNGPNYRDLFPEPPPENEMSNCTESGVIGLLPGIIGACMANEAVKIICDMGEPLSGKLFRFDAASNQSSLFTFCADSAAKISLSQPQDASVSIPEIRLEVLQKWLKEQPEQVFLVDIREKFAFEEYNIGGLNIPLYALSEKAHTFPEHKRLVFLCQSGQRSKMAVRLIQPVFKGQIYSVKNGLS